ncbi:phosphatidylinositol synthase, putative [Babesia caballi]|uniref:Phosphatidylinositol synthase, putative n=1 Tax=Babesia caballi TaxID=5871 RepID=A0AAV4LVR0_BABCB|nr:phosphatidylinositol synthase, putative [Babesia caballi]
MSSSYLCFINGKQHPQYLEWFYLLMVIDICGHWLHNYACALYSNTNHKDVKDAYFILRVYYQTKWLMVAAILMYESFLGAMYVRPMYPSGHIIHGFMTIVLYVSAPLFAYKTLTNFLQGVYGCSRIMRYDIETAN